MAGGASGSSGTPPTPEMIGAHPALGDDRGPLVPDVPAEQQGPALRGLLLPQQAADERRLAGAVAAEQGVDRSFGHRERNLVQGEPLAVADGEALQGDRIHTASPSELPSVRPCQAVSSVSSVSSRLGPRGIARLA